MDKRAKQFQDMRDAVDRMEHFLNLTGQIESPGMRHAAYTDAINTSTALLCMAELFKMDVLEERTNDRAGAKA